MYVKKYRADSKNVHHYKLQHLADVHFNPRYDGKVSKTVIWVLSLIGVLLIVTACLNFINLATARAISRSKEVGVRKTLGSVRGQIFWQFTTETGIIVLMATCLAFAISYAAVPYINELFNSRITLSLLSSFHIPIFLAVLVVMVTLLAGFYPGLVLSGFKPVLALKGKLSDGSGSLNVRRALITTQFVISQVLLFGLIVAMYQTWYVRQADLGFNQEGIVMIPIGSRDVKMNTLRSRLAQIPQVETVSLCLAAPASDSHWGTMFSFDNRSETEEFSIIFRGADENYLSTFDIDLIAGRNLIPSDTINEFLVNETLVHNLGFSAPEEVLGKSLSILAGDVKGQIVGVMSDFHDQSFKSGIEPVFITTAPELYNVYALKINMKDGSSALSAIRGTWAEMYPDEIFEYQFLDDQIASFYKTEETMLKVIEVFSFIALTVGCMGLFGLVSFMASRKTKEIGIRKILGGSVGHILWIFGKEFSRLVFIAFLVAAPIGWWLMSRWLENYAYRVEMTWWIFGLEVSIILVLVIVTVGYHSVKTAMANPVRSLRTE